MVAPKGLLELLITLISVSTNLLVMALQTWAHIAGVICAAASTRALLRGVWLLVLALRSQE